MELPMISNRKLRLESLEERNLLAVTAGGVESAAELAAPTAASVWVVNTTDDPYPELWDDTDSVLSLREAIGRAGDGDTIVFDSSLAGGTIALNNSCMLSIDKGITIDAASVGGITIDANGGSRVFYIIGSKVSVEFVHLTIMGGREDTADGGGIYNYNGSLKLTDCTVSGNTAGAKGGGIYNDSGSLTLTNCTVSGNSAGTYGGGIHCGIGSSATITDSVISENSVTGTDGQGGGIHSWGTVLLADSVISGNTASGCGGGLFNGDFMTVTHSSVWGNTAVNGGGIYNELIDLTLTDSAIFGNTAVNGGGIFNCYTLSVVNNTVSGNAASGSGGGIYNSSEDNIVLILSNSIVTLNDADADPDLYLDQESAIFAENNNLISDDPGFVTPPVFESGVLTNLDSLDLSLTSSSKAVNAGENSDVTSETDLAGNPRIVNGIVDIGAFEYQGSAAEQLAAPAILTGTGSFFVSHGANRHQVIWSEILNASGYELAWTSDGQTWETLQTSETAAVITGLTYGDRMTYRVRALGSGSYTDSAWGDSAAFNVCPMDVDGDGDVTGGDRSHVVEAWLSGEGDDNFRYYADIDADGDVTGGDYAYLTVNWLLGADSDSLVFPPSLCADSVFEEFASADLAVDLGIF